jgi:hypothetical protein
MKILAATSYAIRETPGYKYLCYSAFALHLKVLASFCLIFNVATGTQLLPYIECVIIYCISVPKR